VGRRGAYKAILMKCLSCQGTMARGTAPCPIDRQGYHFLLDTMPAWVCAQCGEAYFDEAAVEARQEVSRSIDAHAAKRLLSASDVPASVAAVETCAQKRRWHPIEVVSPARPNKRLQPTPSSVRSSLAPASGRG
jgi:YgiT-type zinc finger domain-containing protein